MPTRFENKFMWACAQAENSGDLICGYDENVLHFLGDLAQHTETYKFHATLFAANLVNWVNAGGCATTCSVVLDHPSLVDADGRFDATFHTVTKPAG